MSLTGEPDGPPARFGLSMVDFMTGSLTALALLAAIIAAAPADAKTRDRWLERLWEAYQEDDIPYIEALGDYWGALCASVIRAISQRLSLRV